MKKCRMLLTALLSVFALGSPAFQFAQSPSASTANVNRQDSDHASLMGLMRTINTLEATDFYQYGSYSTWQTLLEHHEKDLNGWLARFYSREANVHFGRMPEILPGWGLRLLVQTDGQGYVVVLEDTNDKTGYAALSDERGIIRECKYLQ
jgi:hypothetical protein